MKRKVGGILLLFILFLTGSVYAQSLEDILPKAESFKGYVYDEVGILNEEDIDYINNTNSNLQSKTGGQIAVVIVNNLKDYDSKEYAVKLFEKLAIGDKEKLNGMLILFSAQDRRVEIETGYGTEGFIPDIYAYEIVNNMISFFKQNQYREGLLEGYNLSLKLYEKEYGIVVENAQTPINEIQENDGYSFGEILFTIILLIIIYNVFKGGGGTYIYPTGRTFRGGFYGGSGRSFRGGSSGGFGGFRGGGGRSGGGGAGGSW